MVVLVQVVVVLVQLPQMWEQMLILVVLVAQD
jgi:hypothetical protein